MPNHRELVESVDRFISFFRETMKTIDGSHFRESRPLFQKILYVGLLDALSSTTTFSKKERNRERFTSFIRHFAGWQEHYRVSLPHLVRLLEKVPDPEFSPLRQYAFSLIDKWSPGDVVKISDDPTLSDIKKYWPPELPKPFGNLTIEHLLHLHLLYRCRNVLVHESRKPGYGDELEKDSDPFYYHMTNIETNDQTWELVYPVGFFQMLCRTAIENLYDYFIQQKLDPYAMSSFGTYWIEELNG